MVAAVTVTAIAAAGCSDGGSADDPRSPTPTRSDAASAMPSPEGIVPADPSGFVAYKAGGPFTVDLPSGWEVTLTEGLVMARPEGGGPDPMVMVASEQVDGTDLSPVLERLKLDPANEGRDVEVPAAAAAQRFSGEAFVPYELVVAVDDDGYAAAVAVFDDGEMADEQREHVLGSLTYTDAGASTPSAAS